MSFFCRVDKSTTGSAIKNVARLQFLAPSTAVDKPNIRPARGRRELYRPSTVQKAPGPKELEDWFIGALVGAGQCSHHAPPRSLYSPNRRFKRPQSLQSRGNGNRSFFPTRRLQHTASCEAASPAFINQTQLLALVDQYDAPYDSSAYARDMYQLSPGPDLIISDKSEDVEWPPREYQWSTEGHAKEVLQQLGIALRDRYHDSEDIYHLYRLLPAPRVPYLSAKMRHRLLRHLGTIERKDEHSMLRYLSVVDDMKLNAIPMTVDEWNTATSFVARYITKTTGVEVEAALQMFKEMEHGAGVLANSATFNILFDAATKAGKFHLAEMIYKEMESRGLSYNRFHHVSLIFFYGLRGDGDGVRKAYKAFVEAGEIVDTVVMNSVIASLIRAKEPQAAMQVYERMVSLYNQNGNSGLPARDYQKKREVDRALVKMARIARSKPHLLELYKRDSIIAPDVRTYRILINYLAVHGGQLQTTTKLLDEMSWFGLPIHGSIFLALFHGFANHGGEMYSHWTPLRLESVWAAFVKSHHDKNTDVYMGKWIAIWALKAFAKCTGIARTRQVWDEINSNWAGKDEEMDHIKKVLHSLIEEDCDQS